MARATKAQMQIAADVMSMANNFVKHYPGIKAVYLSKEPVGKKPSPFDEWKKYCKATGNNSDFVEAQGKKLKIRSS